jgi:hypothetical protein
MPGIQAAAANAITSCSIKAFAQLSSFILARDAYACRVQSLRRPDAAEKGNNLALIVFHGISKGSAIAASERVTLIQ